MKKRGLVLVVGLPLAAMLAYFLRGWIQERVMIPLAYLWWQAGLYYHSVPQDTLWALVVVVILVLAARSFLTRDLAFPNWDVEPKSLRGEVDELTVWVMKISRGVYYKWYLANRLSRLAQVILMQRKGTGNQPWDRQLNGPGWDPPAEVQNYLRSGLNRPGGEARSAGPPLDLDPERAVEYLESQMENHRYGNW